MEIRWRLQELMQIWHMLKERHAFFIGLRIVVVVQFSYCDV